MLDRILLAIIRWRLRRYRTLRRIAYDDFDSRVGDLLLAEVQRRERQLLPGFRFEVAQREADCERARAAAQQFSGQQPPIHQ